MGNGYDAPDRASRLKYYLLGLPPSSQHRDWVVADVQGAGFLVRSFLMLLIGGLLGAGLAVWLMDADVAVLAAVAIGATLAGVFNATVRSSALRERTLARYERRWSREHPYPWNSSLSPKRSPLGGLSPPT